MNINSNVMPAQRIIHSPSSQNQQAWNAAMPPATGVSHVQSHHTSAAPGPVTVASNMRVIAPATMQMGPPNHTIQTNQWLDGKKVSNVAREVDPSLQLDDDVEEMLLHIADSFIENVAAHAAQLTKLRSSTTLDAKDIGYVLERQYNMSIGSHSDEKRSKPMTVEAHRQRMALIRKTIKKS